MALLKVRPPFTNTANYSGDNETSDTYTLLRRFIVNELGPYPVPLWLSTGITDPISVPAHDRLLIQSLVAVRHSRVLNPQLSPEPYNPRVACLWGRAP